MTLAIVLDVACLVCITVTLLPLSRREAWWMRVWDFPRLQIVTISLAALGLLLAFGGTAGLVGSLLAIVLLGCIAYQLAVILPYTRFWPLQIRAARSAPSDRTFSLLVVNVLMENRQADALFALIRAHEPDVVLALETDLWWSGRFEQMAGDYPFRLAHPLDNTYGMLLYSKLVLVEPELRFVLKPGVPSMHGGLQLRSGEVVRFHGVHPEPPSPPEADSSAPRDAELVLVAREVAATGGPTLVAGDLNDVAWSHTSRLFRRISQLLDPRIGRGMFNSFHAGYRPLRWPLDHIFVSEDFLLRSMLRLPAFGSDHFPILIALDYAPRAVDVHDAPTAESNDHAEADRKLEMVGLDPAQAPGR